MKGIKSVKKALKNNIKLVIGLIIGSIISGTTVYGATILFAGDQVSYDNTTSGLTSTNVQDALDELNTKATTCLQSMIPNEVYRSGNQTVSIGDDYTSITAYVTDYTVINEEVFFRHIINSSGKVVRNDLCVMYDTLFCFKSASDDRYFAENQSMAEASLYTTWSGGSLWVGKDQSTGPWLRMSYGTGSVEASYEKCYANSDGQSYCTS